MTLGLEHSLYSFYDVMGKKAGYSHFYLSTMDSLAKELDDLLSRLDTDILSLFEAISIKCEDFVFFCEYHRSMHIHADFDITDSFESCCERFFNKTPFFNSAGTCYTTNAEMIETNPTIFNSFKIWLNLISNKVPSMKLISPTLCPALSVLLSFVPFHTGFDIYLKGSDAAEREGAMWALSTVDHPSAVLITEPKKLARGGNAIVSLEITEVRTKSTFVGYRQMVQLNKSPWKTTRHTVTSSTFLAVPRTALSRPSLAYQIPD